MLNSSSFSAKSPAAPALLACKRARNAPACYQLFAGSSLFQNFLPTSFLFTSLHVGARSALLRLIFCLWLQNTPSAIPFLLLSARTHAQFTRSVSSALATVSLLLPTFRGFESISKLFANIFLVTSLQRDAEPIASGFNIIFYSYGGLELRYRFATSLR